MTTIQVRLFFSFPLTGMAKLPSLTMKQCRGAIYCAQGRDESRPYGVVNRSLFHVKRGKGLALWLFYEHIVSS
jgi:hypothetical protein